MAPGTSRRTGRRLAATGLLAACLTLLVGSDLSGLILHSITIDGNVSDWGDVLTDPENVVADAGSFSDPVDPDLPGTSDRDLRGVAFTWDSTNLYFFIRRTLSGNSSFDFLAYIDLGHDGRLNTNDVIVRLSYNGSAFSGGQMRRYVPVNAAQGDAITGDGVDEPGAMGGTLPGTPTSANSPDGIEFEAAVPWTALGVPAGSCLWIHPAISRGTNLPSQVEDNTNPLDTQDVEPTLTADQDGSSASPGQADYAHRACNQGSCGDTLDLTARSGRNWRLQLFTDPNGDGDPSDGVLLGTDGNGDGDYSDDRDGDSLQPGADTNGNDLVDTGVLAAGQCFDYVLRVFVPSGVPAGTVDTESVRARSATRPRDLVRNTDHTNVGPITVFADETATGFAGSDVWVPHVACNEQAFADTILLSATDTRGWALQVWSDPDGDGDQADGAPITSVALAPGACAFLLVRATVPGGEATGAQDAITLRGTSQASASVTETALDTVTVAAKRFAVTPANDRDAGPGNVLFLPHVITNNQGIDDSFALTATSAQPGYTITILTDPNGDGEPDDSTTIAQGGVIGPVDRNGGTIHFLIRVDVPTSAAIGSTNTVTVTARSQADTTRTDQVADTIHIRKILTYSDPLFARPSKTFFTGCSKVYVQAHALQVNKQYRFLWTDPAGIQRRTSPTYSPDARGRADDSFALPCGPVPGQWTIKLQEKSGSTWVDTPNGTTNFSTLDPALEGGDITRLDVDQPIYNRTGDAVSVESTFTNDTDADYIDTFADYVIFKDDNGDGQPTAGEPYILADGTRGSWAAGDRTHRTEPIGVLAGDAYEDYWRVGNVHFDLDGTWCVQAKWVQRCNSGSCSEVTIDTALTCFLVSCLPAPATNAGADKTACDGDATPLSDSSSDADQYSWSDGGAGGTFSPSATVLHPNYSAPGPGTFTLTLTTTFSSTGCRSQDSLVLTVNALPTVDAGANKTTCAGDAVALTDSSSNADTFAWSDGGAGGTFSPSANVLHPSYAPPDPSASSVTLTLRATQSTTGCTRSDTLALTVNPNPVVDAGANQRTCAGDAVSLADSSSDADQFSWSDGGVGGTFTPSSSVLHPSYAPPDPSPASVTLTFRSTRSATGCDSTDTLTVTVDPNPSVNAGADKTTCAGDAITLSDSSASGDTVTWSDGGAGGTFSPSTGVLHPSYRPPDPSPGSITLSLTTRVTATGCDSVDSLVLTVNANPVIDAGANKTTCAGDAVALSDATSDADQHAWSDGGAGGTFTPSASVLNPSYRPPDPSPSSVTLTLTSTRTATGCDSVDTLTVTVNPNPVIDAGAGKTTCAGQGVALSDATSNADQHAWSDGGAGGTFTPGANVLNPTYAPPDPSPSTITLTLTSTRSATGCDSVDTLTVSVNPRPVMSAGADKTTCAGDGVALSDASSDASQNSWSDAGAGGTFTPSVNALNPTYTPPDPSPATITLTLTSTHGATGCTRADSLLLTVDANPSVDAGAPKRTCAGQGVALSDASSSGDQFQWSDGGAGGAFAPSSSILQPTYTPPDPSPSSVTLTLRATNGATGCDATDTLVVTVDPNPVVDAGANKAACASQDVSLSDSSGGAADAFSWSDGGAGGTFTPSASVLHPSYRNATPGTRTLTLTGTVSATGCSSQDSLSITIHPRPTADAGANKDGCVSQDIALSDASSDADTFSWSDGGAGGTFTPSATVLQPSYRNATAGTYTLTLTATHSSTGCSSSDTMNVTVRALPTAVFGFPGGTHCEDQQVCFTNSSTQSTSWLWEFGDPSGSTSTLFEPCFTYSAAGTYTVRLTATNSCGSDVTTRSITVSPKPVAEFTFSTQGNHFCRNRDVSFTDQSSASPTSWSWDFGDGATSTQQDPTHAFATDGIFIVKLVACNACGCSSPRYHAVEIAADCNTNCEANSNQIDCATAPASLTGNTCTDHDNFNTTSYPCAPGVSLSGDNKTWDLNFAAGANFIVRVIETDPEPNGYDLDVMISDRCNPPECTAWGDTEVTYDDRTSANDDYWLIVDGRDGTCGPYRLEVECLDDGSTASCSPPVFGGVTAASDVNPCLISGILVEWDPATSWGTGTDGSACTTGTYEIWRAPSSDASDERRVGSARPPSTSFTDTSAVPGTSYVYKVHAINDCCAQSAITTATASATDAFADEPVVAHAGADTALTCDAPTATLQGSADGGSGNGFDWLWSPSSGLSDPTVPNPTVSQEGTYTLQVTDRGNGCRDTDTVVVTRTPDPVASAGPDKELTCAVTVVQLAGSASGGDPSAGRTFSWSPGGPLDDPSSPTPSTSTEGTYTLTVTDVASGCSDTDTVTVTRSADTPTADAGGDKVITCTVPSVTLDGTASGGDGSLGYTYAWSPAAGLSDPASPTPVASTAGTWTLVVTAVRTGCASAGDSVTVTRNDAPPTASAGPDQVLSCAVSEVVLDGSASGGDASQGYTFAWSPAENVDDPSSEDTRTRVAGTYTLTVTAVATGCTDTDTVEVTLDPNAPRANAGPDKDVTCNVSTVTLEGSASGGDDSQGYAFHWEPAGNVSDPDVAQPTTSMPATYTLTVTTIADGCQVQDVMVVRDLTAPPVADAGPARALTCTVASVTLLGSASGGDGRSGYAFHWEPAADVSDPDVAQPTTSVAGTYTLTVTDVYTGCTDGDTVDVSVDRAAPAASAGPDAVVDCDTPSVVLEGSASGGNGSQGYRFRWEPASQVSDPDVAQPTTSQAGTYTLTVTDLANGCTGTDTATVTSDLRAPVASAGPDRALTCTVASVVLAGSASGGNGSQGYAFRWEPASQVSDPDVAQPTTAQAGTYTLTVTDRANGCTSVDTVTVTSDQRAPVANAGPDRLLTCTVASVVLAGSASGGNGSQGYDFRWEPASRVSDPDVAQPTTSQAGTYTLTVTDRANGCTGTDVVVVTVDRRAPVASAGADKLIDCRTASVTLDGSASGGNGTLGFAYAWTPAAGLSDPSSPTPATSVAGTWTLTVTDLANGCTAADSVTVTVDRRAPVANAGGDKVLGCAGQVTLDGSASGGNGSQGYDFHWEPASRVSDPDVASPTTTRSGTYTLTVTDRANGCTSTDTVDVTRDPGRPVASAGADKTLDCRVASVTLDGSASGGNGTQGYSYSWSPAAGLSDPASPTPVASAAGTYTLTVTDIANGCTDTDSVTVTLDRRAPVASAGADKTIDCRSVSVTLDGAASGGNGSAGYDFAWSPAAGLSDATSPSPTATLPGTYTLTVTDRANGCTATDGVVVGSDTQAPLAGAGPDKVLDCAVGRVRLDGSASGGNGSLGYDVSWQPAGAVSDAAALATDALAAGTFTLTVTDRANGCSSSDTVVVTTNVPPPVADAGPDGRVTCANPSAPLSGSASGGDGSLGYSAQWSPASGVADPTAFVTTATSPGTYTLVVTDVATGCRGSDTVTIADGKQPPVADAGADQQLACAGGGATLTGGGRGGDGSLGYAFRWEPAGNVSDPDVAVTTALIAGTYTLTVTDVATGCTATDTVDVTAAANAPVADAGADASATCAVPLSGAASGGDGSLGYAFHWEPAADVSSPDTAATVASRSGTYTLTVTDVATGCTASDTVDVTIIASPVPPEPSALDVNPAALPLLVRFVDPITGADLSISWEDVGTPAYDLHQGNIASVGPPGNGAYDHAPVACALPVPATTLPTPAGNVYFIAVSVNCDGVESSYGRSSLGVERPDSLAASGVACP